MKASVLLLVSAALVSAATIPTGYHVLHEKRHTNPRWVRREAVDGDSVFPVRIALKQRNLHKGMDYLMAVSDPDSKSYGKHYTSDQVVELFAPSQDSIDKVKQWLVDSGVSAKVSVPKSKAWVQFETTARQLEDILKTKYHVFEHTTTGGEHIGADAYHLPHEISKVVDFVTPGVAFASRRSETGGMKKRFDKAIGPIVRPMPRPIAQAIQADPSDLTMCKEALTPACIKALYNITDGTLSDPSNRLGIYEADEQKYSQEDLDQFYATYAPSIPKGTGPKVDSIDGGTAPAPASGAGGEADLDFQIPIPIIYPQGTELYQTVVQNNDIFNTFLDAVDGSYCTFSAYGETGDDPEIDGVTENEQCGTFTPANVISFSYGTAEADYPAYYLQRQCDEFMKLGLQGTTLVISSGDDGVARRSGPCLGPNKDIFTPDTAAACPYVTAVGSTEIPAGSELGTAEVATTSFSSGGGFSNIWTTPAYQKDTVSGYLASHNPGYKSYTTSNGTVPTTGGIYNAAGRAYPDIAANGDRGAVIFQGKPALFGGTSMSAPIMGAIFTRINDERIAIGKGPIGFVNPTLYKNPGMFNDVVVGNQNKGGFQGDSNPSSCGNDGFSAVEGWDPVTGLGTPKYPEMLEVFLAL